MRRLHRSDEDAGTQEIRSCSQRPNHCFTYNAEDMSTNLPSISTLIVAEENPNLNRRPSLNTTDLPGFSADLNTFSLGASTFAGHSVSASQPKADSTPLHSPSDRFLSPSTRRTSLASPDTFSTDPRRSQPSRSSAHSVSSSKLPSDSPLKGTLGGTLAKHPMTAYQQLTSEVGNAIHEGFADRGAADIAPEAQENPCLNHPQTQQIYNDHAPNTSFTVEQGRANETANKSNRYEDQNFSPTGSGDYFTHAPMSAHAGMPLHYGVYHSHPHLRSGPLSDPGLASAQYAAGSPYDARQGHHPHYYAFSQAEHTYGRIPLLQEYDEFVPMHAHHQMQAQASYWRQQDDSRLQHSDANRQQLISPESESVDMQTSPKHSPSYSQRRPAEYDPSHSPFARQIHLPPPLNLRHHSMTSADQMHFVANDCQNRRMFHYEDDQSRPRDSSYPPILPPIVSPTEADLFQRCYRVPSGPGQSPVEDLTHPHSAASGFNRPGHPYARSPSYSDGIPLTSGSPFHNSSGLPLASDSISPDERPPSSASNGQDLNAPGRHVSGLAASSAANTGRYACPYCSKRFTRPSSLKIHVHSHTGEKPFACEICGKGFSVSSNLRRHRKIHLANEDAGNVKDEEEQGDDQQLTPTK